MSIVEQLSHDELRELADFRATRGVVVSLFISVDPEHSPTVAEAGSRLDALHAAGRRAAKAAAAELDRAGGIAVETDLRRAVDEAARNLRPPGFGCFADSLDGLWRTTALPAPVADTVRIGRNAYLVPLVAGAVEPAFVAVVSRERGEIYSLEHGGLAKQVDLSEEQPRRHRDAEAWQQRKLERRIDARAHRHLARIAAQLDRLVRSRPGFRVALVGEDEHTSAVAELLSQRARAAFAGAVRAEAHADAADLLAPVVPLLERSSREHERALVDCWRSGLGRSGLGVQGWRDTLAAAHAGRVELLLFAEAALESRPDALDLAVHLTLCHGGHARRLAREVGFDALDGVGALVRFRA